MRIMDISIFLFCFLLFAGALNEASLFGTTLDVDTSGLEIDPVEEVQNQNLPDINSTGVWGSVEYVQAMVMGAVNFIAGPLNTILRVLGVALNTGGYLKSCIPFLPDGFCWAITAIVNVVYLIGVAQFLSGRSIKMMR